jgi:hypothetical protein
MKRRKIMELIDTALAFALTMAALATVVSVIMEACLRISRMRKKNLIEVMKLLNKELRDGTLNLADDDRWDVIKRVIQNPVETGIEYLRSKPAKQPTEVRSTDMGKSAEDPQPESGERTTEEVLNILGRDRAAGISRVKQVAKFVRQIFGDRNRAGLYDKVSLEYLLRCLAESKTVKNAGQEAKWKIEIEFNRLARKYEEFGSSVSASFKRHAQAWSIGVGILLALSANIDGLRIIQAYRVNPDLRAAVIDKREAFKKSQEEALESTKALNEIQVKVNAAEKELADAVAAEPKDEKEKPEWKKTVNARTEALEKAKLELAAQASIDSIQQTAQRAQQHLSDLVALGVPLGWKLYPRCPYGGTAEEWGRSSPRCKEIPLDSREKIADYDGYGTRVINTALNDFAGFALWLLVVVMTGILIGLGAPFWFDVAKRLSHFRKEPRNPAASAEYRLSGKDANGDYEERKKIVKNVLDDAFEEAELKEKKEPEEKAAPIADPAGKVEDDQETEPGEEDTKPPDKSSE